MSQLPTGSLLFGAKVLTPRASFASKVQNCLDRPRSRNDTQRSVFRPSARSTNKCLAQKNKPRTGGNATIRSDAAADLAPTPVRSGGRSSPRHALGNYLALDQRSIKMKYLFATTALLGMIGTASADSCWTHNGSLMRLEASGKNRTFSYEVPRPGIWARGVAPGTELFTGITTGQFYVGTARVFTPYGAREYQVSGPVAPSQTEVRLYGQTGVATLDALVFNYSHQC
jgi:hypothetical protein